MLRVFLLIFNMFFNRGWFLKLVGVANNHFSFMPLIFIAYAATEDYANKYIYKWFVKHTLWKPYITGLLKQNGKWTLMTGVSSTEDLFNKENILSLRDLNDRAQRLKNIIKAKQVSYAGILPGVMFQLRIVRDTPEADITAKLVVQSEAQVRLFSNYGIVPLIILGGKGFVGRRVVAAIKAEQGDREIYIVDKNGHPGLNEKEWPSHLKGQKVILINLTRGKILFDYISYLWPEMVLLNEVYPEPEQSELDFLRQKEISAFHIVGAVAKAWPSFPKAYKGGIPCCAAYPNSKIEAIIKKLN